MCLINISVVTARHSVGFDSWGVQDWGGFKNTWEFLTPGDVASRDLGSVIFLEPSLNHLTASPADFPLAQIIGETKRQCPILPLEKAFPEHMK